MVIIHSWWDDCCYPKTLPFSNNIIYLWFTIIVDKSLPIFQAFSCVVLYSFEPCLLHIFRSILEYIVLESLPAIMSCNMIRYSICSIGARIFFSFKINKYMEILSSQYTKLIVPSTWSSNKMLIYHCSEWGGLVGELRELDINWFQFKISCQH